MTTYRYIMFIVRAKTKFQKVCQKYIETMEEEMESGFTVEEMESMLFCFDRRTWVPVLECLRSTLSMESIDRVHFVMKPTRPTTPPAYPTLPARGEHPGP